MNLEEIDKWLDNEYGVSYTELEKIHDWLVDKNQAKDKEIERLQKENKELKEYNEHLARSIKDYEELLLEKQTIINQTREMLYKRDLDSYDTYTANVVLDIQSDFEEIFRGEY